MSMKKDKKMIELKLPNNAAVAMLKKRMSEEFEHRQKLGQIPGNFTLDELDFKSLLKIAEASAIDLVFLLPFEIHTKENNLPEIIAAAMQTLGRVFNKLEFNMYDIDKAKKLLSPARELRKQTEEGSGFILN